MTEFEAELEQARKAGVSHEENLPFLFEPAEANGRAVLLVHGFSASPYEMRFLGQHLCDKGYLCLGVRLAGHATRPEDLQGCRWQDWLASVERGFRLLEVRQLPISLVGQSTGALLGLHLAHYRQLDRMVLLSPFLKLRHPLAELAGLFKYLVPYERRQLPETQRPFYYERRPLAGIEQICRLRDKVAGLLPEIGVPTLVLAAEGDLTVARDSGRSLFEKLGSEHKAFHLFGADTPHVLSTPENPRFPSVCHLTESYFAHAE